MNAHDASRMTGRLILKPLVAEYVHLPYLWIVIIGCLVWSTGGEIREARTMGVHRRTQINLAGFAAWSCEIDQSFSGCHNEIQWSVASNGYNMISIQYYVNGTHVASALNFMLGAHARWPMRGFAFSRAYSPRPGQRTDSSNLQIVEIYPPRDYFSSSV